MLEHFLNIVSIHLHNHPYWGLWAAFFIAFLESLAVIGTIAPGSVTVTAIGILVGSGVLPPVATFVMAITGAFLGDYLSFWLGRHFKTRLMCCWPFKRHPEWIEKAQNFFEKHGGKSVFLGRFFGPMRSMVPLVAGMLNLSIPRFTIAAILSSSLWAITYMLPGMALGSLSTELPPQQALIWIVWGFVCLALMWGTIWLFEHYFKKICQVFNALCIGLWQRCLTRPYACGLVRLITAPSQRENCTALKYLMGFILSFSLLMTLALQVKVHGPLTVLNAPLYHALASLQNSILYQIMSKISLLGERLILLPMAILVVLWLIFKRYYGAAIHLLMLIAWMVSSLLGIRHWVASYRPHQAWSHTMLSYSFPSGHVTLVTGLGSFLALTLMKTHNQFQSTKRIILMVIIAGVALSRLYLGVHWLTDAIGGFLLGLSLFFLTTLLYERAACARPTQRSLITVIGSTLLAIMLCYILLQHDNVLTSSAYYKPEPTITYNTWWQAMQQPQNPPSPVPVYRTNRLGHPVQPLNVQILAAQQDIIAQLEQHGWANHYHSSVWHDILYRLSGRPHHLPLLPQLVNNRAPAMIFTHTSNHFPLILRLWHAPVALKSSTKQQLWVGTLHQMPSQRYPGLPFLVLKPQSANVLYALEGNFPAPLWQQKILKIRSINPSKPILKHLQWNGQILLIRSSP